MWGLCYIRLLHMPSVWVIIHFYKIHYRCFWDIMKYLSEMLLSGVRAQDHPVLIPYLWAVHSCIHVHSNMNVTDYNALQVWSLILLCASDIFSDVKREYGAI
jgi:hypothetical protein